MQEAEDIAEKKEVLFLYPAHDVDFMIMTDIGMMHWIQSAVDGLTNDFNPRLISLGTALQHLEEMHVKYKDVIRGDWKPELVLRMEGETMFVEYFYAGIEFSDEDGGHQEEIIKQLKNMGVEIVSVKYGSSLHNRWAQIVSD